MTVDIDAPARLGASLLVPLRRDLSIALRSPGQWLNPLLFFVIVVSLFPIGIGPGPNTLALIAPGVLWVSALLAMLLSLDTLFAVDHQDGTLEQFVLSGQPLTLIVLGKVLAHWLLSGLPLVLLAPVLAMTLNLPLLAWPALMLSLLLGTLCLSLLGAIGAALTVGLRHGGVLLALLVLPLTIPVLIFGTSCVNQAAESLPWKGPVFVLAAFLALALSLAPLAIAAAVRLAAAADA